MGSESPPDQREESFRLDAIAGRTARTLAIFLASWQLLVGWIIPLTGRGASERVARAGDLLGPSITSAMAFAVFVLLLMSFGRTNLQKLAGLAFVVFCAYVAAVMFYNGWTGTAAIYFPGYAAVGIFLFAVAPPRSGRRVCP